MRLVKCTKEGCRKIFGIVDKDHRKFIPEPNINIKRVVVKLFIEIHIECSCGRILILELEK